MAEYIDREALFAEFDRLGLGEHSIVEKVFSIGVRTIIAGMPAADVAPVVHGQWIEDHDYLKCPECGVMVKRDFTFFDIGNWNYCPNCWAKMDGGDGDAAD